MRRPRHQNSQSGSALVTTLLVIVVLTIIVTAFLQSMTSEHQTSRSYLNRYRAELAAQAAAHASENLMRSLFQTYPDSCTAWARLLHPEIDGETISQGTVFYYRTLKDTETGSLPKDANSDIKALLLASGAVSVNANPGESEFKMEKVFPSPSPETTAGLTPENSINLNRPDPKTKNSVNPKSWIGGLYDAASGKFVPPETRVRWVDILEDPTAPRDDKYDEVRQRPKNGVVARYAFWVEDQSFRVDVNAGGARPRGSTTQGVDSKDIDLQSSMETAGTSDFAEALVSLRTDMPSGKFLTASQINYADGTGAADAYEKLKFYVTNQSSALNFSRGGVKRLNLNEVVSEPTGTPPSATDVRAELDRIIAAIGNKFAMPSDPGHKSLSDFGQRFYFTGARSSALNTFPVETESSYNHADIYMQKLAANIRDYIDTDSQPTIVKKDNFEVREPAKADATSMIGFSPPGNGGQKSDTVAVGKEAVPALDESVFRVRLINMDPPVYSAANTTAQYEMEESYYFEFWNPTDKPIKVEDLKAKGEATEPFLLISHQIGYDTGSGEPIDAGRVIEIPLSDFVDGSGNPLKEFPAGKATVLTTDTSPEPKLGAVDSFFRPNTTAADAIKSMRHFTGTTSSYTSGSPRMFRLLAQLGNTATRAGSIQSDYDTHVLLGNSSGVLESFTALPIPQALSVKYENNATQPPDAHSKFFNGGSLKGNLNTSGAVFQPEAQTGDPRSLNEQMFIQRYLASSPNDITRFLSSDLTGGPDAGSATLGVFKNKFLNPQVWPDYTSVTTGADTAPARIANARMSSIGQLGDIYDPTRTKGDREIVYARGGGRTLRVGQSDLYKAPGTIGANVAASAFGAWDGTQTSVSRNRAAWRLADVFSTKSETATPGLINVNGIGRDKGAALKAALYKFKFADGGTDDPKLKGKDLPVDAFLTAIGQRFPSTSDGNPTNDQPFWERGEISEVTYGSDPIFNQGTQLANVDMKGVVDRAREELLRRSLELFTTKGNVYTAYCVGEAITANRKGETRVLSRQQLKVTFAVEPIFNEPLPKDDAFDGVAELASDDESSTKRFRQPDDYRVKVLSVNTL